MNSGKILGSQINTNINANRLRNKQRQSDLSFKGVPDFTGHLGNVGKFMHGFCDMTENGLAWTKVTQDTTTNLGTKASLARSKADLGESVFVEVLESFIVYFASSLLAGKLLQKPFSKGLNDPKLKENVGKPLKEVAKNLNGENLKKVLSVKSGLLISCLGIVMAEYALNYAKNLFTLKMFKQSDFANIANLNKSPKKDENTAHHKKVESSAKKHIIGAAAVAVASIGAGFAIARGNLMPKRASEWLLDLGGELAKRIPENKHVPRLKGILKDYLSFDFSFNEVEKAGKKLVNFGLSNGQALFIVSAAVFGYYGASKDRGELDHKETMTRLALTAPYAAFGSKVIDFGLMKITNKLGLCKDIIKKGEEFDAIIDKTSKKAVSEAGSILSNMDQSVNKAKMALSNPEKTVEELAEEVSKTVAEIGKQANKIGKLLKIPEKSKESEKTLLRMAKLDELDGIANHIVSESAGKIDLQSARRSVMRQKAIMTGIPFAFGIGVMGFAVTLLNQYWTRRRYSQGIGKANKSDVPKSPVHENPALKELFVNFMNQEKKKSLNVKDMEKILNSAAKTN